MRIGDVSKQAGIPQSTLRYYERIGLIQPPTRIGGQRQYDDKILELLQIIKWAKSANFSLDDIRQLVRQYEQGKLMGETWRHIAEQKHVEVLKTIQHYQQIIATLEASIACDCRNLIDCELTH